MLGSTEKMFEVGEINGGGPGEKLLGSRKSIGGAKEIKGTGPPDSSGLQSQGELYVLPRRYMGVP